MLMPSGKPLFENVASKEYYNKANELRQKALDGCIHIAYPDFEETILFSGGQAVSAVHQSKRWLTAGDELVEPAENKALAADGRMAAYELPRGLLDIFVHMHVQTMVETELGPYMTAGLLIGYLEGDKSTCVLKLEDGRSTAYVFINFGKLAGAVYESPEGRLYDDGAIKAMGRFKEHACVAVYFTEPSSKYLKSKAEAKAEARAAQKPITLLPTEAIKAGEPVAKPLAPPEPISPFPVEGVKPRPQVAQGPVQAIPKPVRAPPLMVGVKLVVVMSGDQTIGITRRSRQQTLEALEEGDIAWVDGKTFTLLHLIDPNVSIILPNGREYPVMLKEAPIKPEESRYIILPRKLRSRLSVSEGAMIEVKASL
jgi:hypothetical protein